MATDTRKSNAGALARRAKAWDAEGNRLAADLDAHYRKHGIKRTVRTQKGLKTMSIPAPSPTAVALRDSWNTQDLGARFRATAIGEKIIEGRTLGNDFDRHSGRELFSNPAELLTRSEWADELRVRTVVDNSNAGVAHWGPELAKFKAFRGGQISELPFLLPTDGQVAVATEGTRTEVAAGADYGTSAPQTSMSWTSVQPNFVRRAVYASAWASLLVDKGLASAVFDATIRGDLARDLDSQLWAGDGVGQNLLGVTVTPSLPTMARGALTQVDAILTAAKTIRAASWKNEIAVVLNPTDALALALSKDTNGNYVLEEASASLALLGVTNFVVSPLAVASTVLLGDWTSGSTLFVRDGASVALSRDNGTDFIQGLVSILASTRVQFVLSQLSAFVSITSF